MRKGGGGGDSCGGGWGLQRLLTIFWLPALPRKGCFLEMGRQTHNSGTNKHTDSTPCLNTEHIVKAHPHLVSL